MHSPLYVGIDLGTTNSSAAAFDGQDLVVIRNAAGSTTTPSVVRLSAKGAITVGEKARRFLDSVRASLGGSQTYAVTITVRNRSTEPASTSSTAADAVYCTTVPHSSGTVAQCLR